MKHNFYAGPAILPQEVLAEASEAVIDLEGSSLSILEISHRSKEFMAIMEEAKDLVRSLYQLPAQYEVLFLQGGASTQFYMICMNFGGPGQLAGYIDTGNWSTKAIEEAEKLSGYQLLASSKDRGYSYIPKGFPINSNLRYVHLTSNNTIRGTQFHSLPDSSVPLVADMSSDILSRPTDASRFALIYAGAQKNLGPAGTTLVIIDKDFAAESNSGIPTMVDYNTHISKASMFNTPPVFSVYVSLLTLRYLVKQGGLQKVDEHNRMKASLLYNTIDNSSLFEGTAAEEDRSLMNVTFLLKEGGLEAKFLDMCSEAGCVGIAGHRSVGGFRASIYNAMNIASVKVLTDIIRTFDSKYG